MSNLEAVYAQGSSFARDLFHFIVSSAIFPMVLTSPYALARLLDRESEAGAWIWRLWPDANAVAVFAAVVVLYVTGHLLLSIGFLIDRCWSHLFAGSSHVKERVELRKVLRTRAPADAAAAGELDSHVYCDMSVMHRAPDLHYRFIERYNTLAKLRLGLATAFVLGGFGSLHALLHLTALEVLPLAALWEAVGLFMFQQYMRTDTSFLVRLATAYSLVGDDR